MTVRTRNWIALAACVSVLIGAIWIVAETRVGTGAVAVAGALGSVVGGIALLGVLIFVGELWITRKGPPA